MAIEIRQQFKLSQQLHMTPMLKQAISLLLFSRQELVEAVQRELLENPFLEEREAESPPAAPEPESGRASSDQDSPWPQEEVTRSAEWEEYLGEFSSRSRIAQQEYEAAEEDNNPLEACHSAEPTLEAHLMAQLLLSPFTEKQKAIGECIIGNLDETGYLTATDEEIAALAGAEVSEIAPVLSAIQNFDPVGVAARTLSECLLIQMRAEHYDRDPILVSLVRDHLKDLEKQRYKPLLRQFRIDLETLKEYIRVIQSLEARPGGSLGSGVPWYVSPDIFVRKVNGEFVILMNDEDLPHLQLSPLSEELSGQNRSSEEKDYMNDRLRSAVWIIRSLEERQRTLYQVMESIVKHQREFFENGIYGLKPLVLKDIAEDIGRSESSISRITTNKYVGTPHGIFELKYFFNSALSSSDGRQVGSESVKARIRSLIDGEDPAHPLSDEEISSRLNDGLGVKIARRTVAKYREELGLPSSSRRKKHL
ncbi:RNA polymerase factor sigma-54 [Mailhella massiliensis]|uniref:RNA polymerase factor sigma-54 n=1 Tax=Mailhella massiliensis TaxID=1903261 RepID=A0A921AXJ5_9BACT|nr:RNA polymerase factor sigma-54 [Mailhella massiliensis]HJD98175.1 RNA polymerase factor sigma-54 [Mailhella massiliensis]